MPAAAPASASFENLGPELAALWDGYVAEGALAAELVAVPEDTEGALDFRSLLADEPAPAPELEPLTAEEIAMLLAELDRLEGAAAGLGAPDRRLAAVP